MAFSISETASALVYTFLIGALGFMLGRIHIRGISLGTAGIFIVGLIFGHFGVSLPAALQSLGLVLFMTSTGFSVGPGFLERLKKNGFAYFVICLCTAAAGGICCFALVRLIGMEAPLAAGIMTGSFTTSPGFAAAKEAVADIPGAAETVAAGYGLAYPVGVISKVLAIQLIPRSLGADMAYERSLIAVTGAGRAPGEEGRKLFSFDRQGLFPFALASFLGLLLGSIRIPLPAGGGFSLGTIGGTLFLSLLFGGLGHIGRIDVSCPKPLTAGLRDLGLILFFSGGGTEGGHGVARIISSYGALPILYALVFVAVPMTIGFLVFRYLLKLPLLNGLGCLTGSMTCTPSLAVLSEMAGTDDVAAAYATTYPIALIILLLLMQQLVKL